MEPFALFNLLQSLLGKADAAPSEPPAPDTSETTATQAEPNLTVKPQSENAAARFLDEHERRAKRLKS